MPTWDIWKMQHKVGRRFGSIELDVRYGLPGHYAEGELSVKDRDRIARTLDVWIGRDMSAVVRGQGWLLGSYQLFLRPPMTKIFNLFRDPSYQSTGRDKEGRPVSGDGASGVWSISREWLETHGVVYQGDDPIKAYARPILLTEIPPDRFFALRVAIDHYLETGKPLP